MNSLCASLAGLALLLFAQSGVAQTAAQTRDPDSHFFQTSFRDLPEELQLANAEGKKGLAIMFDAEDCPPCRRMKRDILNQARVQDYYRKHFRVLQIDFNGDREVVDLAGKQFTEKVYSQKGARIRGTPSFQFIGPKGEELARHYGEIRNVDEFIGLAEFVVSGAYRETKGDYRQYRAKTQPAVNR